MFREKPTEAPGKPEQPELDPLAEYQDPLEGLTPDLDEAWRCHLWLRREDPRNPTKEDLWKLAWDQRVPDREEIKDLLGGGFYRLRIQRADGTWRGGVAQLAIHGPPREVDMAPPAATRPAAGGEERIDRLERLVEKLIEERAAGPAQPPTLPLDMTALIKAAFERPVPKAADPWEQVESMLAAIAGMRDLIAPADAGGGESEDLWSQALQFVIEQASSERTSTPQGAGAPAALPRPVTPPSPPTPTAPPVRDYETWIRQAAGALWTAHEAGATAGAVATALLAKIQPEGMATLRERGLDAFLGTLAASRPDWGGGEPRAWAIDLWAGLGLSAPTPAHASPPGEVDHGEEGGDSEADADAGETSSDT